MLIKECDLNTIIASARNKCMLVSAVSFESRSLAAAKKFKAMSIEVDKHYVFDYPTIAEPIEKDKKIRGEQRDFFEGCFNGLKPEFISVQSTSLTNIVKRMELIFSDCVKNELFIDISCFSGIHLIAIATAMFKVDIEISKIKFLYSTPKSYGFQNKYHFICNDIVHVPIGKPRHLTHEGHAIGFVLPGHEPERLSIALEELEPSRGVIVLSRTSERPDFLCSSYYINEHLIKRLTSIYSDDYDDSDKNFNKGWVSEIVDLFDADKLSELVDDSIKKARKSNAPLILYPFGPKVHTLIVALKMAFEANIDTWAIYPIPKRFHVSSTEGVEKTTCFSVNRKTAK